MLPKLYVNGWSCLVGDCSAENFASFMDVRKLRRAETVSKNVLLCAFRALEQAGEKRQEKSDWGISLAMGAGALGSTLKFMDSIIEDGDELSSPTAFASSVHNSTILLLSLFLHIHGPCVVTGQLDSSFAGALLTAQQFLAKDMCRQVLVAITEDVNPLLMEQVQRDPHVFDPFMYQPSCLPQRVAGVFAVSAVPTEATRFVLDDLQLSATADVASCTEPQVSVCSCAHTVLALKQQLETQAPFVFHGQFAGSVFDCKGEPYVRP